MNQKLFNGDLAMTVGELKKAGVTGAKKYRGATYRVSVFLLVLMLTGCVTNGICRFPPVSSNPNSASVERVVRSLDTEHYFSLVNSLESRQTRYHRSESYADAAHWARDYAHSLGYLNAHLQVYKVSKDARSLNVIIQKRGYGKEEKRRLLIVCAHMDSKNSANNNFAPGADDNASGSAAVLEIARVFAKVPTYHDIYFVLFGSEEYARRGSTMYVLRHLSDADKNRLIMALNIDMIGYLAKDSQGREIDPSVTLEYSDIAPPDPSLLVRSGKIYTDLNIVTSPLITNSDHLSFIRQGLPAVLVMEGSGPLTTNPNIHSKDDTVDKMNFDLGESILRMNTAFVAAVTARP
jgi:hypothetical protein